MQVICDNRGKILYYFGGWPGSIHDNRTCQSSKSFIYGDEYFADGEYLLSDSAYSVFKNIAQPFKKVSRETSLPLQKGA